MANESIKALRIIRELPREIYRLPDDGRKWKQLCGERRMLAVQLASYANPDGTNITVGATRMCQEIGMSRATLFKRLADLGTLSYLVGEGKTGRHGTAVRRLDLELMLTKSQIGTSTESQIGVTKSEIDDDGVSDSSSQSLGLNSTESQIESTESEIDATKSSLGWTQPKTVRTEQETEKTTTTTTTTTALPAAAPFEKPSGGSGGISLPSNSLDKPLDEEPEPIAEEEPAPYIPDEKPWLREIWQEARPCDGDHKYNTVLPFRPQRDVRRKVSEDIWDVDKLTEQLVEKKNCNWEKATQLMRGAWAYFAHNPFPNCKPIKTGYDDNKDATMFPVTVFVKNFDAYYDAAVSDCQTYGRAACPPQWLTNWRAYEAKLKVAAR